MADQTSAGGRTGSLQANPSSGPSAALDAAGDEARTLAHRAADEAARVGGRAGDELSGLRDQALDDARDLAGEARQRAGQEADRAAAEAASALAGAALELTTMADRADHPDSPAAELVRRVGERAGSTARHLEARGSQGVVDDVSRFARNRPGLFLLGAAGLGFAVGRLMRNTDTGSLVGAARAELTHDDDGEQRSGYAQETLDLRAPRPTPALGADPARAGEPSGVTGMRMP